VTGKLPGVDLAVIAAFTAAGISLVNVVITAWLASRVTHRQWRREEERPAVVRILALSSEAKRIGQELTILRQDVYLYEQDPDKDQLVRNLLASEGELWEDISNVLDKLRLEVAQLELVGHEPVREAARALLNAHDHGLLHARIGHPATLGLSKGLEKVKQCEEDLIEKTRADLGIYAG
jgi:hypothetical protein